MKKVLFLLVMVAAFVACSDDDSQNITGISLDKTSLDLYIGDSYVFKIITTPENMPVSDCIWSSSNTKVVSVQPNGAIDAISLGSATINVISSENSSLKSSCIVNVLPINAESIEINDTIKLEVQEEKTISYEILPHNTTFKNIDWYIEDSSIASVDNNGKVKGIKLGETKIIATIKDTKISDTCVLKIIPTLVTGIECDKNIKILIGSTDKVNASIIPDNATNKNIIWESLNENIVSVINGNITANNMGTSTIKVVSEDGGFEDQCTVNVVEIDQFVTASASVGTEGSTNTGFYSYLRLDFATNTNQDVNIGAIVLMDENSVVKDSKTNIGNQNTYSIKFVTKNHAGTSFETFPAQGWKVKIDYAWNGKNYTKTVVNN